MSAFALYGLDLVAALILTFGVYWPRHRRRDLVVAFLGINMGILAVAALLASSAFSAGLGLGLFGVLSIIRLRSDELTQHEIAYYFAVLALGLVGGLSPALTWASAGFMALIVVTMAIVDHPRLLGAHRRQLIVLDRAIADEATLRAHLEEMLGADVTAVSVQRLDTVSDTTWVDARYRLRAGRRALVPGTAATPSTAHDPVADAAVSTAAPTSSFPAMTR